MKIDRLSPVFVDLIPAKPEQGVLYISEKYQTSVHLCCCGCMEKVVTPLKPGGWSYKLNQEGSVSLSPSIGNWNFQCQSHYWIRSDRVDWSKKISKEQVESVQERDRRALEARYSKQEKANNVISRVWNWLAGFFSK